MGQRRELAEDAGIADQDIEFFPAFENGCTKPVDCRIVLDVRGDERGRAAYVLYLIIKFFKAALGAGEGYDVSALLLPVSGRWHGQARVKRR